MELVCLQRRPYLKINGNFCVCWGNTCTCIWLLYFYIVTRSQTQINEPQPSCDPHKRRWFIKTATTMIHNYYKMVLSTSYSTLSNIYTYVCVCYLYCTLDFSYYYEQTLCSDFEGGDWLCFGYTHHITRNVSQQIRLCSIYWRHSVVVIDAVHVELDSALRAHTPRANDV